MKNISLKQYTALKDPTPYDILTHLNPKNSFAKRQMNIAQMPYANVKYCIRLLPKVNSWQGIQQVLRFVLKCPKKNFGRLW